MVQFNFTFQPGVSLQQMIGFEVAGRIWSQYLTDSVTVNLHVATTDLGTHRTGATLPGMVASVPTLTVQNAFDITLNTGLTVAHYLGTDFSDSTGNRNAATLNLTRANAKTLGISNPNDKVALDGYILMNSSMSWGYTFDRTQPASTTTLDFLSTALHEIGHALGFISGVDRPGWSTDWSQPNQAITNATLLDLMRYAQSWQDAYDTYLPSGRTLEYGGTKAFSIDGSYVLAGLSTGSDVAAGGDGYQGSHWLEQSAVSLGLMDPALRVGERSSISSPDLTAFGALGWDPNATGVNTAINYSTIISQTKQVLATRLGKTVSWLDANPLLASQRLSGDRSTDVTTMINNSVIYNAGRSTKPSLSPQELAQLATQEALLDTLSEADVALIEPLPKGSRGNDALRGSDNSDTLTGLGGTDRLVGLAGSDRLDGGSGRDVLYGGKDQDLLAGGKGRDVLVGGAGSDLFVLALHTGLDVIRDFTDGQDKLVLPKGIGFKQLHLEQRGSDVLVSQGSDSLMLLRNIDAGVITAADVV